MPVTARIEKPERTVHPDLTKKVFDGTNRPDKAETLFAIGQIEAKMKKVEEAKLELKTLRSGLVLRGHSLDALDHNIKMRDQEDKTTEDQLRERIRVARFMELPYGFQVSFLDEQFEAAPSKDDLMKRAYDEGYELGIMAKDPDEQKWLPVSAEGQEHQRGWREGQAVNLSKLKDLETGISEADKAAAKEKADKEAAKAAKKAKKEAKGKKKDEPADTADTKADAVH